MFEGTKLQNCFVYNGGFLSDQLKGKRGLIEMDFFLAKLGLLPAFFRFVWSPWGQHNEGLRRFPCREICHSVTHRFSHYRQKSGKLVPSISQKNWKNKQSNSQSSSTHCGKCEHLETKKRTQKYKKCSQSANL